MVSQWPAWESPTPAPLPSCRTAARLQPTRRVWFAVHSREGRTFSKACINMTAAAAAADGGGGELLHGLAGSRPGWEEQAKVAADYRVGFEIRCTRPEVRTCADSSTVTPVFVVLGLI